MTGKRNWGFDSIVMGQQDIVIRAATPRGSYLTHKAEIDSAIAAVLDGGNYILGETVADFERAFADWIGVRHGIGVNSGTDALHLALRALGVGAGDEVVVPSHTSGATVAAVVMSGASPVFADVDADCWTLTAASVSQAIGPRSKAVIAVHIYGNPADGPGLRELCDRHGLVLVEDCAQSHGASLDGRKTGNFGHAGCFSFYPTKNLGAIGDAGMVVTGDVAVATRLRLLRQYGWDVPQHSICHGWNSRLDPLQAAVLRAKLPHLEASNGARARLAARYDASFAGLPLRSQRSLAGAVHARHLHVLRLAAGAQRDELVEHLRRAGVAAAIHYPYPVHRQPAYRSFAPRRPLTETDGLAAEILSLPVYPELSDSEQDIVIEAVLRFYGRAP